MRLDADFHELIFEGRHALRNRRERNNLHIAMRAKPGSRIERVAYNGVRITIEGAEALPIPELPRGFRGLSWEFTTCRNYQFGVAYLEAKDAVAAPNV